MNRKLYLFAIALGLTMNASAQTNANLKGDANGDGIIDVADITTTASYILGEKPAAWNFENADANGDGVIDVADITSTASIILLQSNPFLTKWDTPYGIPPFDKIRPEHYIPAIKAGIAQEEQEIEAITSNPEAPTFENTIAKFELAGDILSKTYIVLNNVYSTDRTDELDAVKNEAMPLISESADNISFNKKLYERVAAIYNADQSTLTREQQMVLKKKYDEFVRNGVSLSEDNQEKLKKINADLSAKSQKASNNILAENKKFKEKFGISVSDYPNAMTTTEDRAKREEMLKTYTMRCHNNDENDNKQLFLDVMQLRIDKAKIMGFDNPASYILEDQMAHDTQAVDTFLLNIMKAASVRAKKEVADMQALMDEDIKAGKLPEGSTIQPWDWWYYSEKVRKQKYDLNVDQIRPYFKLENVVNGIFTAAKTLYGVNMERLENVPAYNEEVTTYKVTADDGSLLGVFTTDYFPRDSKSGGAWMSNFINQYYDADGNDVRPVIENVANLEEYLSTDGVQTVFHEFGHALHGLLTKCHYQSVSGTNVTRDYVEMPSQFNENWAMQPGLLAQYAKNDKGEVIPDSLVQKINNSKVFNQGFMTSELCAAAILDMKWHELSSTEGVDIDEFEKKVAEEIGLIPEIGFRYRTTYFDHIISGGYNAGYYGYLWSEVLDKDLFSIFESSGNTFNPELAKKFKETFLEKGGSEDPMILFEQFAGRKPDNTAFLKARGLE